MKKEKEEKMMNVLLSLSKLNTLHDNALINYVKKDKRKDNLPNCVYGIEENIVESEKNKQTVWGKIRKNTKAK